MTLITKGMGAIIKGALKKAKVVKKEFVSPKTNIPLYVAGATVLSLRHAYEKEKEKSKKKKKDKDKE